MFIVVSHDCDLAERDLSKEPLAEIVESFLITQCDPGFTHSKSTRILHVKVDREDGPISLELRAATKTSVSKALLEDYKPNSELVLAEDERNVLSHWLAARYRRASFPNELVNRLGDKITGAFAKAGKKHPHAIRGIFLDYDPETELANIAEPYELWVYVVYVSEIEGAKEIAQAVSADLLQKFEREFVDSGRWQRIEVRQCEAVSDTEFSIADAVRLKFFRLDHLSLRESPPGETPDLQQ